MISLEIATTVVANRAGSLNMLITIVDLQDCIFINN
jgi:hypothetical protein